MVGKASSASSTATQSQQPTTWPSTTKIAGLPENMACEPLSSDSDDDNAEEFLIQANTQKRPKFDEDDSGMVFQHVESKVDIRQKNVDALENEKIASDSNKKRSSRGRGNLASGRGRGSRGSQTKSQTVSPSNGQPENLFQKDELLKEQIRHDTPNLLEEENNSLREKVAALEEALSKYMCLNEKLEKEMKEVKDIELLMKPKRIKILSDLLISVARAEREEARMRVRYESARLGNVAVVRAGTVISETWEDGLILKDLNFQLRNLLERKETIERQRKLLKKRHADKGDGTDSETGVQEDDFPFQDEMIKSRLCALKREEEMIMRERDRYELEKARLIREMKRIRDEDGSRFNNYQILNHRYALLNLLGKGGFSEVYKAFDLVEYRYVACKLHGLSPQWSEEKKQSYIRHAIREYNIHKTLVHQNIVRLWDIFEIDQNTFCTVLEYCSGKDLDAVLKSMPALPEREARAIIAQIFRGLVYLNRRSQKIIHYDLKPGNVLFDEVSVAKVTDFGLSKIVEDDVGSQGMELTSQGAGTYWYLPPECFELNKTPLISSKVDVWSAGILLYQMLFGRRPFGHDQTQERILREDTIINARKVEFPSRPTVSNEAKEFIRRCLTYNQAERPDVLTISQDPYIAYTKK